MLGILKNPSHTSPPVSPSSPSHPVSAKEATIANTHYNAGNWRTPSTSRRAVSRTPSLHDGSANESSQRLKWDEANLYLTEQERTPKMKIDEPKTPFARGYESLSDDEDGGEIPGLELGEPERKVPERRLSDGSRKAVQVKDGGGESGGESAEEREKHKRFEEMRKKHYEMKGAVQLLGHPEEIMEDEDDEDDEEGENGRERVPPPVPPIPQKFEKLNGS